MEADFDLLLRWRNGDKTSGSRLFARHFASLRRFFANKVGDVEAEDLIQSSMLECMKSRETFRGHSSFRTFLFTIARRQLWHHLRRRDLDAGRREPDFTVSSVADYGPSPSYIAQRNEAHARIAEAMRRIPIDLQIALELHYWEQLNSTELGEVLGISPVTVRTRLHRAREALRAMLSDLDDGAPARHDDLDETVTRLGDVLVTDRPR